MSGITVSLKEGQGVTVRFFNNRSERHLKFSILIPTKDRLDLLKYAVKSILQQTYENFELIISDNYSNQDIGKWLKDVEDERIIYFRQNEAVTVTENWNTANDMATGDYIIMLGDDDALLPNSLQTLYDYIDMYHAPDLIEFPAYLYLQPNVDPNEKEGNVQISPQLFSGEIARFIPLEIRENAVKECFKFNYTFGFNMQYFCYSKKLIKKLQIYGKFYEPPYPDYYTACMMMLLAEKVLHIPERISIIGITKKSYGFYYRNNIEKEGMEFHKEVDYRAYAPESVRTKLCSVDEIHTAAMATFSLIPMRIDFEMPDLLCYYKQVIGRELGNRNISEVFQLMQDEILPHLGEQNRIDLLNDTFETIKSVEKPSCVNIPADKVRFSGNNILEVIANCEWIDLQLTKTNDLKLDNDGYGLSRLCQKIQSDILKEKIGKREVLVWGAYERGRLAKEFLESLDIKISAFVDSNSTTREYLGISVVKPVEIENHAKQYYIVIPLRSVVKEIVSFLEISNYEYMADYYYVNYSEKVSVTTHLDIFGNRLISESDIKNTAVTFYGQNSEIIVSNKFDLDCMLTVILYGNDLRFIFKDKILMNAKVRSIVQVIVSYEDQDFIKILEVIVESNEAIIEIPPMNGYSLIYDSDHLLAVFEVSTRKKE